MAHVKTHTHVHACNEGFAVFINRAAPEVGCVKFLHYLEFFFLLTSSLARLSGHAHARADARMQPRKSACENTHTNTHAPQVWPPLGSHSLEFGVEGQR